MSHVSESFQLCMHIIIFFLLNILIDYLCFVNTGTSAQHNGTQWMRKVENVTNGDVIGVAVQQSDLPMVQYYLNGESLYDKAVNRFRGSVYPAICLPGSVKGSLKVDLVLEESKFKQSSPGPRFGPVIVARSIV